MGTPWSVEAQTLFKLLRDGQWHPYLPVHAKLASTIAPGRALRFYDRRLEYRRKYSSTQAEEVTTSEDERIHYGQRGLADRCINGLKRRNLEIDGEGEGRQVRIVPGAEMWSIAQLLQAKERGEEPAGVPDPTPADSGPSEPEESTVVDTQEPPVGPQTVELADVGAVVDPPSLERVSLDPPPATPPEIALFSEKEVRRLIREEVAAALDGFQTGMQVWMQAQFAQLERPKPVDKPLSHWWFRE